VAIFFVSVNGMRTTGICQTNHHLRDFLHAKSFGRCNTSSGSVHYCRLQKDLSQLCTAETIYENDCVVMAIALISLGANLGERATTLDRAIKALHAHPSVQVKLRSTWKQTLPVGGPPGQHLFLNGAALLETDLEPHQLLAVLQAVENDLGRDRQIRWDARRIDLDLLLYDEQVRDTPKLTLPHPRMSFRRFVLESAEEIAPQLKHPVIGWTIRQLLDHLNTAPNYLALAGGDASIRSAVAERVARETGTYYCTGSYQGPDRTAPSQGEQSAALQATKLANALVQSPIGVISDYWMNETQLRVSKNRDPEYRIRVSHALARAAATRVVPKLVVLLEPVKAPEVSWTSESNYDEVLQCVTHPGRGPYLVVSVADLDWAVSEIAAAMIAMR
jgi:2-amino-4-hydroxy-6-hydroxymethyldihydropteridine diphosphokinase